MFSVPQYLRPYLEMHASPPPCIATIKDESLASKAHFTAPISPLVLTTHSPEPMQGLCCLLCLLHHPPLPWPLITVLPANTHMSTFRKTSPLLSYTDRQSGHWILRWKSAGNIDSVLMCMARWLHNYYTSKEPILENPQRSRKKYTVAICKRKKKHFKNINVQ